MDVSDQVPKIKTIEERSDEEIMNDILRVSKEYNFDKTKGIELDKLLMEAGYKISIDKESNLLYVDAWTTKKEILDGQKTVYIPLIELKGKNDSFPVFKMETLENDQIFDETEINDHFRIYPNLESWFTSKVVTTGSYGFEKALKAEEKSDPNKEEVNDKPLTDAEVIAP